MNEEEKMKDIVYKTCVMINREVIKKSSTHRDYINTLLSVGVTTIDTTFRILKENGESKNDILKTLNEITEDFRVRILEM